MRIHQEGQSPGSMKSVGFALGLIPFVAGLVDGFVLTLWHDVWVESHRKVTRFSPANDTSTLLVVACSVTLLCVVLSAGSLLLSRMARDLNLGMGRTAWRLLFIGCGLAGFAVERLA